MPDLKLQIINFTLQIVNSMLQIDNSMLQTNDLNLKIDDFTLQTNDLKFQINDSMLQIDDFTLQIINTKLEKRFSSHQTNPLNLSLCSTYESLTKIMREFYHENRKKQALLLKDCKYFLVNKDFIYSQFVVFVVVGEFPPNNFLLYRQR